MILLPIYILAISVCTSWLAMGMGNGSSQLWIQGVMVSFIEDLIILQPLAILFRVFISRLVMYDIFSLQQTISNRSKWILQRRNGIMRDCNSSIQRSAISCMIARMIPNLPISRLIMSLNDYDLISNERQSKQFIIGLKSAFFWISSLLITGIAFMISLIPSSIVFAILELAIAQSSNLCILGMIFIGSVYSAAIIGMGLGMMVIMMYLSKKNEAKIAHYDESMDESDLNEDLELYVVTKS
jgi:hypothetical protein